MWNIGILTPPWSPSSAASPDLEFCNALFRKHPVCCCPGLVSVSFTNLLDSCFSLIGNFLFARWKRSLSAYYFLALHYRFFADTTYGFALSGIVLHRHPVTVGGWQLCLLALPFCTHPGLLRLANPFIESQAPPSEI